MSSERGFTPNAAATVSNVATSMRFSGSPDGVVIERVRRTLRDSERLAVLRRDDWRCRYCGARLVRGYMERREQEWAKEATIDHVLAISRGGQHDPANLVAACWGCNMTKGRN